ncbi:hypothetical protein [Bauldia litoralis]|uniref:hypothetical protein n=1 Tax=Bauldia litoralis TaxID=665467 RepID=UPI00326504BB
MTVDLAAAVDAARHNEAERQARLADEAADRSEYSRQRDAGRKALDAAIEGLHPGSSSHDVAAVIETAQAHYSHPAYRMLRDASAERIAWQIGLPAGAIAGLMQPAAGA